PSRYPAYARREHRWVRGDWQLLPWLGRTVPTPSQEAPGAEHRAGARPNVLPALERWKVIDNLRRSLVPPAVLPMPALRWTVLPGGPVTWSLLGLAVLACPVLLRLGHAALKLFGPGIRTELANVRSTLPSTLGQSLLSAAFLAYQAVYLLDAIGRTLARLY